MLLFRSEEHVARWRSAHGLSGEAFSVETMWRVAEPWFRERLSPSWRRPTAAEAERLFAEAGWTGDFWRLA